MWYETEHGDLVNLNQAKFIEIVPQWKEIPSNDIDVLMSTPNEIECWEVRAVNDDDSITLFKGTQIECVRAKAIIRDGLRTDTHNFLDQNDITNTVKEHTETYCKVCDTDPCEGHAAG